MKKIANITYHHARNYGSILQTYALQRFIINMGFDCIVINYYTDKQELLYYDFLANNSLKAIIKNILSLPYVKYIKKRNSEFENFLNRNVFLTDHYESIDKLSRLEESFDCFICGSDQIWNLTTLEFDSSYFLSFIHNKKKISYAASTGGYNSLISAEDRIKVTEWLKTFKKISVREYSGIKLLRPLTEKEIEVLCDPTLLLDKETWNEISSDKVINEDYIFFYSIDYNDEAVKIVKLLSKRLKLPVVILFTSRKSYRMIFHGFNISPLLGPSDFLSLVKYASYVFSTSFHGTAFSIIFEKKFYVIRGRYNGVVNQDDRMTTLLSKLEIKNRDIDYKNYQDIDLHIPIDYKRVQSNVLIERKRALNYLHNAIMEE